MSAALLPLYLYLLSISVFHLFIRVYCYSVTTFFTREPVLTANTEKGFSTAY